MKEKLFEGIKAKFNGLDDTLIEMAVKTALKKVTDEAGADEYIENLNLMSVINSYKDSQVTEALKTRKRNEERQATVPTTPTTPDANEPKSEMSQMLEMMQMMKNEIASLKADKVFENRNERFTKVIANLPDAYKNAYKRTDIKSLSDDDFSSLIEEIGEEVGNIEKQTSASQSVTTNAYGSRQNTPNAQVKEATDSEVDAILEGWGYSKN